MVHAEPFGCLKSRSAPWSVRLSSLAVNWSGQKEGKKGDPDALSERKLGYLLVDLAADLDHPKSNWILFVVLAMLG